MKGKGKIKTFILQTKKKRSYGKVARRRSSVFNSSRSPRKSFRRNGDKPLGRIILQEKISSTSNLEYKIDRKKAKSPAEPSQYFDNSLDHMAFDGESIIDTLRGDDDMESIGSYKIESEENKKIDSEKDEKNNQNDNDGDEQADSEDSIDFEDIIKKEKIDERKDVDNKSTSKFRIINLINQLQFPRSELERYFLRKTLTKHEFKINAALIIISFDSFTRDLCLYGDSSVVQKFFIIRIFNFFILIVQIFLASIYSIKTRPQIYKKIMFGVISARACSRLVETAFYIAIKDTNRVEQLVFEMVKLLQVECILMITSGIFYIKEILVFQVSSSMIAFPLIIAYLNEYSGYQIFTLVAAMIFNFIDSYYHSLYEIFNFNNFIKIERKSLHLSQFVNRLLPKHIQDRITEPGAKLGQVYKNVTLLYADIVGFTAYSNENGARKVVEMLSRLFTAFDKECSRLGLYKVYTIGDCYVVMSFLDENNRKSPQEEANDVTLLAISMINNINKIRDQFKIDLNMRIGIHTGDIIGGVIGTDLVRFDIYGQDVVVANKMESKGFKGKINVSETTRKLLEQNETCNYSFVENKEIYVKSTGMKHMSYFLGFD